MTEWLKDILGLNRYVVETTFLNGRHSIAGVFSKRKAREVLADRQRRWWYAVTVVRKVEGGGE